MEGESAIHRRAAELLGEVKSPKKRFEAIRAMACEHLPVQPARRLLNVAESGYYARPSRPQSNRLVQCAWPTEAMVGVHTVSRGTYGSRPVHAEPGLGLSVHVSHGTVELQMQCAGLHGLPGNRRPAPKFTSPHPSQTCWNATSPVTPGTSWGSPTGLARNFDVRGTSTMRKKP